LALVGVGAGVTGAGRLWPVTPKSRRTVAMSAAFGADFVDASACVVSAFAPLGGGVSGAYFTD
jgi:hypothetical protein